MVYYHSHRMEFMEFARDAGIIYSCALPGCGARTCYFTRTMVRTNVWVVVSSVYMYIPLGQPSASTFTT